MTYFKPDSMEQAILNCVLAEAQQRGASRMDTLAAAIEVVRALADPADPPGANQWH